MNIDSIQINPAEMMLKHKPKYGLESKGINTKLLLSENKSIQKEHYNGSFTGINVAAVNDTAKNLSEFTHKSGGILDAITMLCDKHTVIAQNLVALFLTVGLRPLAIMSLPGKEKDKGDKIYASAHAIASGIIGFIFSSILMYPLGVAADKVRELTKQFQQGIKTVEKAIADGIQDPHKGLEEISAKAKKFYGVDNLIQLKDNKKFKRIAKTIALENGPRILGMAPDVFIFGVVKGILTIKLIKPILKYGFGIEKASKSKPEQLKPAGFKMLSRPDITQFAGDIKQ